MKRKNAVASENPINFSEEKVVRVQLGTRIAARFLGVGLEEPLPEMHLEVDSLFPEPLSRRQDDAQD